MSAAKPWGCVHLPMNINYLSCCWSIAPKADRVISGCMRLTARSRPRVDSLKIPDAAGKCRSLGPDRRYGPRGCVPDLRPHTCPHRANHLWFVLVAHGVLVEPSWAGVRMPVRMYLAPPAGSDPPYA